VDVAAVDVRQRHRRARVLHALSMVPAQLG
jgi:hypothetical protein